MVAALTTALALAVFAPPSPSQQRCELYSSETYSDSVTLYRDGQFEEATQLMATVDRAAVQAVHRAPAPPPGGCQIAAALIHTELAAYFERRSQSGAAAFHLEVAEALAFSQSLPFQRDWRFYVAMSYQQLAFTTGAEAHLRIAAERLRDALEAFPHDTELLVAEGAVLEWSGDLDEALERYEDANRLDVANARAKLRHGKVLQKLDRPREAVAPLAEALELTEEPIIIYRARMALGRSAEFEGRSDAAIAHYEAAIELLPGWQVGYIALAHALHASGERARSDDVITDALRVRVDDESFHGWWSYELGLTDRIQPTLAAMRERVSW